MSMTGTLIPIYGCAALIITVLGVFARQNRKSGWTRKRPNMVEALEEFYSDLGFVERQAEPLPAAEWKAVTPDESISFSAQMLKLRGALGTSTPVTAAARAEERALTLQ